jgi:hypothetical protein
MARQLFERGVAVSMVMPRLDGSEEYDPSELTTKEIERKLGKMVTFTPELAQRLRAKLAFQE